MLSKGYLYTNADKETEYSKNIEISVAYAKLIDKLDIENIEDKFINENGEENPTKISDINYAYYKTTTISKENFEKILGQDGVIKILKEDGTEITTISKDTSIDENGNYVYTYTDEINEIKIETTKPIRGRKITN